MTSYNGQRRLRVLFAPQWYPFNDPKRTAGSFNREHVHAAALYEDVAVLAFASRSQRLPTLHWSKVDDEGVPTFCATYGHSPIPKTSFAVFSYQLRCALRRVIEEWGRPDVIHTQDEYSYYVIKAAKKWGVPFVISQHSGAFLRRQLSDTSVRRYRWAFARAASILAANKFAANDYATYGIHAAVSWLPNTLDTATFYPSVERTREPALLHVSSLEPIKRFPDIVHAFARVIETHPHAILRVVGGRHFREEMEALAGSELPRENFKFHGYLAREEVASLMRSVRGLVLASEHETFSCVLMEAMACGCPVLTSRVGGIPAVVRDGDGIFFDVGAIDQIVSGMQKLLDGDHGLDMHRTSQETRSRFSHETIGQILHDEHMKAVRS